MKTVFMALSVPNQYGQQIFAAFADATDKRERFKVYKPKTKEYWKEVEIQNALTNITRDLQRDGYTVEIVPISEYHGVLDRHKKQVGS